jgi:hypothetical protein
MFIIFIFSAVLTVGCTERTDQSGLNILPFPSGSATPAATSSPHTSEEPQNLADTSGLETIYGIVPADLVDSHLSKQYFSALVKHYKASIEEPDNTTYGLEGYPFQLFAIAPFENGALLLAGYTIDQDFPDLYYMEGEKVLFKVTEAEYFSLNYTVFKNHTISYGLTLAEGESNRSVKTVGTFANGEVIERSSKPIGNYKRGYILIANGQTWLSSIKFFDQSGNFVTDETSDNIGWNESCYHWKDKPTEVWNVQRYTQMRNNTVDRNAVNALVLRLGGDENENNEMHAFTDDGSAGIQYVWRSHNNLNNGCAVKSTQKIEIDNLPPDAEVYWVDIERDDGTDENIADLLVRGDLQTPDKPGVYCLIVKADGMIHTLFVEVAQ